MTSKEKALELTNKFYDDYGDMDWHKATVFAAICVDEMIEECRDYCDTNHHQDRMSYWQSVKTEIQSL